MYLGRNCCIRANVVVFGKRGNNLAKWLYSGKVVVFVESGFFRAKWLYSSRSGYILAKAVIFGQKLLCSDIVVVFGQNLLNLGKVVVFTQSGCIRRMWFYSGKVVVFGQ